MTARQIAPLFARSVATLGGGGIGQIWGATDHDEAVATVHAALDSGIRFFDVAPLYGCAEEVLGRAFSGGYPADVGVSTKCMVGTIPTADVVPKLTASLDKSCARLGRSFVDLFILHGYVIADGWRDGPRADLLDRIAMPWTLYSETIVPALETLVAAGRIDAWGITGCPNASTGAALTAATRPQAIQVVTNALNSSGNMAITAGPDTPDALLPVAAAHDVAVMGVRALAAGALAEALDRPAAADSCEARDFARAAGFRSLAHQWGMPADQLAHRYALSLPGVDTVVLGAKNRAEIRSFFEAERAPRLSPEERAAVRASAVS